MQICKHNGCCPAVPDVRQRLLVATALDETAPTILLSTRRSRPQLTPADSGLSLRQAGTLDPTISVRGLIPLHSRYSAKMVRIVDTPVLHILFGGFHLSLRAPRKFSVLLLMKWHSDLVCYSGELEQGT